jgi:hypothetical protein
MPGTLARRELVPREPITPSRRPANYIVRVLDGDLEAR